MHVAILLEGSGGIHHPNDMGAGWTATADAAAGRDRGSRPLTIAEADDALYRRLTAVMREVAALQQRVAAAGGHPEWDRALQDIVEMLIELIEDADYVELAT